MVNGPYFIIHDTESDDGLVTTLLILSFKVTDSHYENGRLHLKCTAQMGSVYLDSDEEMLKFTKHSPTESVIVNTVKLANKIQSKYKPYKYVVY